MIERVEGECVAIVGSRDWPEPERVREYVRGLGTDDVVVSGHYGRVDLTAEDEAERTDRAYLVFPAQWKRYGKNAGPRRNPQVVANAHRVVVFWDGASPGSHHVIELAKLLDKPVEEIRLERA